MKKIRSEFIKTVVDDSFNKQLQSLIKTRQRVFIKTVVDDSFNKRLQSLIKTRQRVFIKITLLTLLLALLQGCSGMFAATRDITDFKLISIVGIDTGKGDSLKLTVSAKEESKPKGEEPDSDKPLILTNTANTVSRAFGGMQRFTDKRLYLGHDRYCLIGERAAERDIGAALDFFERDANARLDTQLFIVKDAAAEKLLTKASGNNSFAADRLSSMEKDTRKPGGAGTTSIVDISNALDDYGTAAVRALKLVPLTAHDSSAGDSEESAKSGVPDGGAEEERFDFDPDGYAIFKDRKLAGYMPEDEVAGYILLNGENYFDYLEVRAPDGMPVSLQTEKARRDLKIQWDNGVPVSLLIKISFKTILEETRSRMAVADADYLNSIEEAQNALIKRKVQAVVDRSKEMGRDFTGIGEAVNKRHPVRFSKIKSRWNEIWTELPVEIEVSSIVASSYNVTEPNGQEAKNT